MKLIFSFITIYTLGFCFLNAQIGIQTETPLGIFHIDSNNDNTSNNADKLLNDVIVTSEGRVGIGTTNPTTALHINTGGTKIAPKTNGFRLVDGNQLNSKILSSDANGNASWADVRPRIKWGNIPLLATSNNNPPQHLVVNGGTTRYDRVMYSGMSITLSSGHYMLTFSAWVAAFGNIRKDLQAWSRFSSIFLSFSDTDYTQNKNSDNNTLLTLTNIRSIIIPYKHLGFPEASNGGVNDIDQIEYAGSGNIPIAITGTTPRTVYLWVYMYSLNYLNPEDNSKINGIISFNQENNTSNFSNRTNRAPFTELYATPIIIR